MEWSNTSPRIVDSNPGDKWKWRFCPSGSGSCQRRTDWGDLSASTGLDSDYSSGWRKETLVLILEFKFFFFFFLIFSSKGSIAENPGGCAFGAGLGHDASHIRDRAGSVSRLCGNQDLCYRPGSRWDGQLSGTSTSLILRFLSSLSRHSVLEQRL